MPGYGTYVNASRPMTDHPLNDGRRLWLRIVNNSGWRGGSTVRDMTRRGRDGTLSNGPAWVGSGRRRGGDGSLSFTAASSQTVTSKTGNANMISGGSGPPQGWTVAVSMYLSSNSMKGLVLKIGGGENTNGLGIGVGASDADTLGNNILMLYESVAWHTLASSVGTGWFHVAVSMNPSGTNNLGGTVPSWTVNGIPGSGSGFTAATLITPDSIQWGGYATRFWNDMSGDVSIWDRALSSGELGAWYQEEIRGCPNTLNWVDYPPNPAPFGAPAAAATTWDWMPRTEIADSERIKVFSF